METSIRFVLEDSTLVYFIDVYPMVPCVAGAFPTDWSQSICCMWEATSVLNCWTYCREWGNFLHFITINDPIPGSPHPLRLAPGRMMEIRSHVWWWYPELNHTDFWMKESLTSVCCSVMSGMNMHEPFSSCWLKHVLILSWSCHDPSIHDNFSLHTIYIYVYIYIYICIYIVYIIIHIPYPKDIPFNSPTWIPPRNPRRSRTMATIWRPQPFHGPKKSMKSAGERDDSWCFMVWLMGF